MAAPYNPPVKGEDFVFTIGLQDLANPGRIKANPTLASGDFKVDIDGAGFNNLATLPTVSPSAGRAVRVTLSTSEMNGNVITFQAVDQTSPAEWADVIICIPTVAAS